MAHKLNSRRSYTMTGVAAVAFGLLGWYLLGLSGAATSLASAEAEAGVINGRAMVVEDGQASEGKAIRFGADAASAGGCIHAGIAAPCIGSAGIGAAGWGAPTFSDDFDGTSLDTSKWESTWFGEGTRMNNVGTYAKNVSVAGGEVRLQLSSNSEGALIHTGYKAGHYQFPVGSYVEARIYFPGNGSEIYNWPAWWANSTENYPSSGEHDIAEGLGQLTVNYHSPTGTYNQGAVPGIWSNAFHTYGVHRQANKADVYWDGQLVKSYATSDDGRPQDLILNVGTGGGSTVLGQAGAIRVDYVRAWKQ